MRDDEAAGEEGVGGRLGEDEEVASVGCFLDLLVEKMPGI